MSDIEGRVGQLDSETERKMTDRNNQLINDAQNDVNRIEIWTPMVVMERFIRPCFAEFFGTMLFVFLGSMSGVAEASDDATSVLVAALAHGFAIAMLIAGIGAPSGGHFNPCVTLGILIAGELNVIVGCLYIVFQLLGAICGSGLVMAVLTAEKFDAINGGATLIGEGVATDKAIGCEWILTMVLVSTVLQAAVESKPSNMAPLVIGLAVVVDILAGGTTSGASMNPARSFGPAVVSGIWTDHWVYWVGPPAGAVCSGLVYRLLLASPDKRWILKED
ncbi:aquaporin-8-like isoform X2 [Glandiceps talaboti]